MNTSTYQTVLLAVTGMSPAVLTETIWALACEHEPVVPDRVIVVTTSEGQATIERELFSPVPEWNGLTVWQTLREAVSKHLALPGDESILNFDPVRVFITPNLGTGRSTPLPDLRTRQDNDLAADFLLEQVRGLVETSDTRVIASLAGGRKTMGALLYACMTLVGRETDRLTHVLVNGPFDTLRGFWFPAQPGGPLPHPSHRDGATTTMDPAQAIVELADVPFVPLRNLFQRELGQQAGSFRRLVDQCCANVRLSAGEHLRLEIGRSRPVSIINGRPLELSPREHLVLLFFAIRAKRSETILSAYDEALHELEDFRLQQRADAPPNDWSEWRHSPQLANKIDDRGLTRLLSDIRTKARRAGGDAVYLADVLPAKGRCALDVPSPLIFIKD